MKKVAIVTGASRSIGASIAEDLAKDKYTMILAARDREGLEDTARKVSAANGYPVIVETDVTREDDRQNLISRAEAEGDIEILVNNAGVEMTVPVLEQTSEEVERQLDVNLLAPILLTRRVLPGMINRKRGCIVMISSMSGKAPTPFNSVYAATKHGIVGFSSSILFELEGTGVKMGVVCPSFVRDSGMWASTGVKAPLLMREVPIEKVVAGVRKVLAGQQEVLVTPGPVRPLLALSQLRPSWMATILRCLGVVKVLEERTRVTRENRKK